MTTLLSEQAVLSTVGALFSEQQSKLGTVKDVNFYMYNNPVLPFSLCQRSRPLVEALL